MALATTTLAAALAVDSNVMVVASATSITAGRLARIDGEFVEVAADYVSGTTVGILRGREGTATAAHVITANVVHGDGADWSAVPPTGLATNTPYRPRSIVSVTATSTLTLPKAGEDMTVILNGTSVITLTVPVPTNDMDGCNLVIMSNGVAAHVPTFTGGFGGVGSGYTALTVATGAKLCISVYACNGAWMIPSAPAWTGTVTKVTAGIA